MIRATRISLLLCSRLVFWLSGATSSLSLCNLLEIKDYEPKQFVHKINHPYSMITLMDSKGPLLQHGFFFNFFFFEFQAQGPTLNHGEQLFLNHGELLELHIACI